VPIGKSLTTIRPESRIYESISDSQGKQGTSFWLEENGIFLLFFCKCLIYMDLRTASGGIRTPDRRIRNPVLYPTELQTHLKGI
jgi:hypothetical protein